jgi:hypothetical protein
MMQGDLVTEKRYKWGYHVEDLARAVEETRKILVEVAKNEDTISYTDLCNRITAIKVEPETYALANILGQVSAAEDRKGNGMLSVLVVYKDSLDLRPGPGFFNLARELDYDLPDKEAEDAFWIRQSEKVYDQWSRRRQRRRRGRIRPQ